MRLQKIIDWISEGALISGIGVMIIHMLLKLDIITIRGVVNERYTINFMIAAGIVYVLCRGISIQLSKKPKSDEDILDNDLLDD